MRRCSARQNALSVSEDLFHFPTFGQFVHQFVQISNLLCQRVLDIFHTMAADNARDEARIWVQGGFGKKAFKCRFFIDELLQLRVVKASQPFDDVIQFIPRPTLLRHFREIQWVNRRKRHLREALILSVGGLHSRQIISYWRACIQRRRGFGRVEKS